MKWKSYLCINHLRKAVSRCLWSIHCRWAAEGERGSDRDRERQRAGRKGHREAVLEPKGHRIITAKHLMWVLKWSLDKTSKVPQGFLTLPWKLLIHAMKWHERSAGLNMWKQFDCVIVILFRLLLFPSPHMKTGWQAGKRLCFRRRGWDKVSMD